MEEQKRQNRSIINIGTSLMVVILIGLSFAVIAALTISSSHNNYSLSVKQLEHTNEYYAAKMNIDKEPLSYNTILNILQNMCKVIA